MRLVIDQGLPPGVVALLQLPGWDVIHVRDVGMAKAEDEHILDLAAREDRICATLDNDFPEILARTQARGPGVILFRMRGLKAPKLRALLLRIEAQFVQALEAGAVLSVKEHSVRIRTLPIRRAGRE